MNIFQDMKSSDPILRKRGILKMINDLYIIPEVNQIEEVDPCIRCQRINHWLFVNKVLPNFASKKFKAYMLDKHAEVSPLTYYTYIKAADAIFDCFSSIRKKPAYEFDDNMLIDKDLYLIAAKCGLLAKGKIRLLKVIYELHFPKERIYWESNNLKRQKTPCYEHPTVNSFLLKKRELRNKSLGAYKNAFYQFASWLCAVYRDFQEYTVESLPLRLVTVEHLEDFFSSLNVMVKNNRLVASSANYIQNYILAICKGLYHEGHLLKDITVHMSTIRYERYQYRDIPGDAELQRLFEVMNNYSPVPDTHKIAFQLILYLGLRKEEVSSIKWKYINLSKSTIVVHGKGDRFDTLLLPLMIVDGLKHYLTSSDSEFVFSDNPSEFAESLYSYYKIFAMIAGWKYPSGVHLLRHTYLTNLAKNGCPVQLQRVLARHTKTETTSLYTHHKNDELVDAINKLNYL